MKGLIIVILSASLLSCGRSGPESEWIEGLRYDDDEVIDITLNESGSPTVPVTIDGVEFIALFDTGEMEDLLVSTTVANILNLPKTGIHRLFNDTHHTIAVLNRYRVDSLQVFDRTYNGITATEIDTNDTLAVLGPGYLGHDRFTIDFPNRVMALSNAPTPDTAIAGIAVPMIVSPRYPALILIEGMINRSPTVFVINTGKRRSTIHPHWAQLLRLPKVGDGYRIDSITVGNSLVSVRSAPTELFADLERDINRAIKGSLGADALAGLRITVDYAKHLVYVYKQPEAEPET